ncbi:MAG: sigma-70 family RNA polymerase sigma factor [Gemmatimonadota bacterium]
MEVSELDDRALVVQACDGRDRAFEELLRRYERPVFTLVLRMVRDRELAEDLAQEAFIKAFQAIRSYDPAYKFSSWIFKIANNLTIDHLRRRRIDTVSIDGSPHASSAGGERDTRIVLRSTEETPEAFVENRELGGQIEDAIARLRPEYRTAVLLRHVEGYSYEEVAEIMEVPLGTAKTYIHRGRTELRTQLAEVTT